MNINQPTEIFCVHQKYGSEMSYFCSDLGTHFVSLLSPKLCLAQGRSMWPFCSFPRPSGSAQQLGLFLNSPPPKRCPTPYLSPNKVIPVILSLTAFPLGKGWTTVWHGLCYSVQVCPWAGLCYKFHGEGNCDSHTIVPPNFFWPLKFQVKKLKKKESGSGRKSLGDGSTVKGLPCKHETYAIHITYKYPSLLHRAG